MAKRVKRSPSLTRKGGVSRQGKFQRLINTRLFGGFYCFIAIAILFTTVVIWSIQSSNVQNSNSDQLVNVLLFGNWKTFHGAQFPGQHTLLLKWPIFVLANLFNTSTTTISIFTLVLSALTILALIYILYRIERRPLVFGTLCLALASVLLLVPTQPYSGALLPVNMAMLTTRNIEYIFYIVALILLVKSPKFRNWRFWGSCILLTLLFSSDKLFMSVAILGAVIALVIYALFKKWPLVTASVNWLIVGIISIIGSFIVLSLINITGLTHIVGQSSVDPYSFVHSLKDLALGIFYAFFGILSNFGANPSFDATSIRDIPSSLKAHLLSLGGVSIVINLVILVVGLIFVWKFVWSSFVLKVRSDKKYSKPAQLSLILIWTSAAAVISFVVTDHYYLVDARYLTICMFTVFIVAATYLKTKDYTSGKLLMAGMVMIVGIFLGFSTMLNANRKDNAALADVNSRNAKISEALLYHPVDDLVGDYWRVVPTKIMTKSNLTITPLVSCTQPEPILTSSVWQPSLENHSFAYVLTLDSSLTNYPNCTIKQITSSYGRPNTSLLISGSYSKPSELLLFYDHGIHKSSPKATETLPSTIEPVSLTALPYTSCPVPTIMNIVAHEDDDLLFINPDIYNDIKAGHCIRTVYITAGDGGLNSFYWLSRQRGVEAAYTYMTGDSPFWVQRIAEIANNEFVTVANPRGNSKISLIFLNLPDGDLKGEGFKSDGFQSLEKLDAGQIKTIKSVDGQSTYSLTQLEAAIASLLHLYQPSEIRTQSDLIGSPFPDHSDHRAVGRMVTVAYHSYETQQYNNLVTIPIKYYLGYDVRQFPVNITGAALAEKINTFLTYTKFDGATCQNYVICEQTPAYANYLDREYQYPY